MLSAIGHSAPTRKSRREKETHATHKLLADAEKILSDVDDAFVFQHRETREYPRFQRSEIKFGPVLGIGGFGIVFEVKDVELRVPTEEETKEDGDPDQKEVDKIAAEKVMDQKDQNIYSDESNTAMTLLAFTDDIHRVATSVQPDPILEAESSAAQDNTHYDVRTARNHIAGHVRRNGDARYAVKRLHRDLSDLERARGMIDLAIEAKFLSVIWHPNIIKMRAVAAGPFLSPKFFIVMDRLYETLTEKMKEWAQLAKTYGGVLGFGGKKLELKQLLCERMVFAYDIASAFWYMHENKIVYRDTKQENIGFDIRGDVKVFDFGLCKGLSPSLKNKDGPGYLLTARTGSVPYMAPEVAECKPYDCKCDVFSIAMLVWELISLKTAFKGYSPREFLQRVVRRKERLPIKRSWPPLTRLMIKEAWEDDPQKRPDMKRVAVLLRGDLNEMTTDPSVQNRTQHMRERSAHSIRLARSLNTLKAASEDGT